MKILFYRYKSIFETDCLQVFRDFGVDVDEYDISMNTESTSERLMHVGSMITDAAKNNDPYLFVFSINFFPIVSDLCERLGVIYACWSVDCPVNELLLKQVKNKCNRIFLFDQSQYERIHRHNPSGTFYLPLATNTKRLQETVDSINDSDRRKFSHDISFIGSLYNEKSPLNSIKLSDKARGYIDGIVSAQLQVFGYNFIENTVTNDLINEILGNDAAFNPEVMLEPLNKYIVAHSYIGMEMAVRERREILNALATSFDVNIYTQSDTSELVNVHNRGPANTLNEMPKIFNLSKINLNITMRPIATGLSLRIYDCLGSGGFLITNYQSEIPSLYEIDKDIVVYSSIDELREKCEYYLNHEEERKEIAYNGFIKTHSIHNCHSRIKTMFQLMLGEA